MASLKSIHAISVEASNILDAIIDLFIPEDADDSLLIGSTYVEMLAAEFCSGNLTPEQLARLMPDSDAHRHFFYKVVEKHKAQVSDNHSKLS